MGDSIGDSSMRLVKTMTVLFLPMTLVLFLLNATGCAKDYSFERKPQDTLTAPIINAIPLSSCANCREGVLADSTWQFTVDGVLYCGKVEKTVVNPERNLFTFFGPSACSKDSGFVATVSLEGEALKSDQQNISAKLGCYYYDKVKPSHVYSSLPMQPLQMMISEYRYSTGMATGSFSGFVSTESGLHKEVKNGRFRIRL